MALDDDTKMFDEFGQVMELLKSGGAQDWESLSATVNSFPLGVDSFIGRRWIINAIDEGSAIAVEWMLQKNVELDFRDAEGYTPLHAVLDRRKGPDKYRLLELLLKAGAPVNRKGLNDWTPAHMAAARDDVEALRILVRYGADVSIRTDIDDCVTPLEEARSLGQANAVKYLESVV